MSEAMRSVDVAWLRMGRPGSPANGLWLVLLEGRLSRDEFLRLLWPRLLQVARLCQAPRRTWRGWRWLDVPMDPQRHVLERPCPADRVDAELGRLMAQTLDPSAPPWRVHLLQGSQRTAMVWQQQHCVGDGVALSWLLERLSDEPGRDGGEPTLLARYGAPPALQLRHLPAAMLSVARVPKAPDIPYVGLLSAAKVAAVSAPIPLARLRRVADGLNEGVGDLQLALVAGGLRRDLQRRGASTDALRLHAALPINLRGSGSCAGFGNAFGVAYLQLPVHRAEAPDRLAAIRAGRGAPWLGTAARVGLKMLGVMGAAPLWGQRAMEWLTGSKTTLVLSSMPALTGALRLGGQEVRGMACWAPPSAGVALTVTLMGYDDQVRLAVAGDAARVPDPGEVIDAMMLELSALEEQAEA